MNTIPSTRRPRAALSAAALAMGLALAGCGSAAAPSAAPGSRSATPAPGPASASPTAPTTPAADLVTFTFTSQKLSLRYPKTWTAESKVFDQGRKYEAATFKDASGKLVFSGIIDFTGYDVGWPVQRTVIDSGAVPGLAGGPWNPSPKYAFFAEEPASGGSGGPGTLCTLKLVTEVPADGPGTLRGLKPVPEAEKCASVDGARQWWASAEGQQVKAAAASLTAG